MCLYAKRKSISAREHTYNKKEQRVELKGVFRMSKEDHLTRRRQQQLTTYEPFMKILPTVSKTSKTFFHPFVEWWCVHMYHHHILGKSQGHVFILWHNSVIRVFMPV